MNVPRVVVIGAGVGGLSAAAVLARAGLDVTVLEAHIYPGGCAGTFYHQGYRFDAGATLAAGFYPGGPMDLLARAAGIDRWPSRSADAAMQVHLPGGARVIRWADDRRWEEHEAAFGKDALPFWRWQEDTADALWDMALRLPAWPPQDLPGAARLAGSGLGWLGSGGAGRVMALPGLAADAFHPVSARLHGLPERLRLFVDGQLLISAQADSQRANALYGAAALDLPRRGVVHLEGGMGAVAQVLAQAVRDSGGRVITRQEATRVRMERGKPVAVETRRGGIFDADVVIANLTPWDVARLFEDSSLTHLHPRLRRLSAEKGRQWGAFVLYLGIDEAVVPAHFALHHQLVLRRPLGEGNTVFLSLSPDWDASRAPRGKRALTLSTHTELGLWWNLFARDPDGYKALQQQYAACLMEEAEQILPGLRQTVELILPGTPLTFQRFTRRDRGWVGGFPQTSLFNAWGPRLGNGIWMVGDSIFPGQSVAAVALGGLRVAEGIIHE